MRQSALVVLCIFVSFTSAGVLDSVSKRKKTKVTSGSTEVPTNSSAAIVPTADGGELVIDMCEGNVVIPLSYSRRNVKRNFTVKSTHFPFKRSVPLICSWNVKVSKTCRRGLVTMTINERSRLAGEEGCLNGYYSISPFMDQVKICGRINSVPPFQWYVENQEPEVTINLKHVGLNDGYSEGLSFTLSGECLNETIENKTTYQVTRSYSNWLQQLYGQSLDNGVPTLVLPEDAFYTTTGSPLWSETEDDINQVVSNTTTTTTNNKIVLDFDLETPWHVLKNHSVPSRTSSPSSNTKPHMDIELPHPIIDLDYIDLNQTAAILSSTTTKSPAAISNKVPVISGTNFNLETPWHILKNQSLMASSSTKKKNNNINNDTNNVSLLNGTSVQTVEVIMWT